MRGVVGWGGGGLSKYFFFTKNPNQKNRKTNNLFIYFVVFVFSREGVRVSEFFY